MNDPGINKRSVAKRQMKNNNNSPRMDGTTIGADGIGNRSEPDSKRFLEILALLPIYNNF